MQSSYNIKLHSHFPKFFSICLAVGSILGIYRTEKGMRGCETHHVTAVYLGNLGRHVTWNPDGTIKDLAQIVALQKVSLAKKESQVLDY